MILRLRQWSLKWLMKIKICGLRRAEDALMINEFEEIKYAGLVFAKSKRQISVDEAVKIKRNLRSDIKVVGVFADQNINEVSDIIKKQVLIFASCTLMRIMTFAGILKYQCGNQLL